MNNKLGWIFSAVLTGLLLSSCVRDELPVNVTGDDSIILQISSTDVKSKAIDETAIGDTEKKVEKLDIFIFNNSKDGRFVAHESFSTADLSGGRVVLRQKRSALPENARYWVYLVANSKVSLDGVTTMGELLSMKQSDPMIHVTGLGDENVPASFVMDGIAYTGSAEPSVPGAVVLNDGVRQNNTELTVSLRRAAAKIVVSITGGEGVKFTAVSGNRRGFYLRNMPYETTLLSEVSMTPALWTPDKTNAGRFFDMSEDVMPSFLNIVTYAYSAVWKDAGMDRQTSMLVNIPMYVAKTVLKDDGTVEFERDADGKVIFKTTPRPENWYRIPLTMAQELKRNHCYRLTLTINAPGATDEYKPVEIKDVEYKVLDWEEERIEIGGDDDAPQYLTVNRESLEMHNMESDNTSLKFNSSSEVTVTVKNAYYYNKFGQKTNVTNTILQQITATPDPGITGHIKVYSPLPTNNAIRYIELEVKNKDGMTRNVLIYQYPLEYITNVEGWYSYRDDFVSTASDGTSGVTTWELLAGKKIDKGTAYNTEQVPYHNSSAWICGCSWSSSNQAWSYGKTTTNFFGSKVAQSFNETTGLSDIEYARWSEKIGNWSPPYTYTYNTTTSNVDLTNHRMYHVTITSTSGEYTLGRPRLDANGYTDSGEDNAKLVSPSFMLASQLGAVMAMPDRIGAAQHCEKYVEVARDGTVYNDWRLPTRAEINIIYKFQNDSEVMDEVLAGNRYWGADGLVPKPDVSNPDDQAIRCIRDAYAK